MTRKFPIAIRVLSVLILGILVVLNLVPYRQVFLGVPLPTTEGELRPNDLVVDGTCYDIAPTPLIAPPRPIVKSDRMLLIPRKKTITIYKTEGQAPYPTVVSIGHSTAKKTVLRGFLLPLWLNFVPVQGDRVRVAKITFSPKDGEDEVPLHFYRREGDADPVRIITLKFIDAQRDERKEARR